MFLKCSISIGACLLNSFIMSKYDHHNIIDEITEYHLKMVHVFVYLYHTIQHIPYPMSFVSWLKSSCQFFLDAMLSCDNNP